MVEARAAGVERPRGVATLTSATLRHTSEPPVSVGPRRRWSSRTIACVQADSRPTPSTAQPDERLAPALTPSELPAAAADQVGRRRWTSRTRSRRRPIRRCRPSPTRRRAPMRRCATRRAAGDQGRPARKLSSRTVACAQRVVPQSVERPNCDRCARPPIRQRAPLWTPDQVEPASVDVRYSYPATPEPASIEPAAVTVSETVCCQPARAPDRWAPWAGRVDQRPCWRHRHRRRPRRALPAVSTPASGRTSAPVLSRPSDPPAAAAPTTSHPARCGARSGDRAAGIGRAGAADVTGPTVQAADRRDDGRRGGDTSIVQRTFLVADRVRRRRGR
jgi:hypothetical protein